jgi:hypothetical protein
MKRRVGEEERRIKDDKEEDEAWELTSFPNEWYSDYHSSSLFRSAGFNSLLRAALHE